MVLDDIAPRHDVLIVLKEANVVYGRVLHSWELSERLCIERLDILVQFQFTGANLS